MENAGIWSQNCSWLQISIFAASLVIKCWAFNARSSIIQKFSKESLGAKLNQMSSHNCISSWHFLKIHVHLHSKKKHIKQCYTLKTGIAFGNGSSIPGFPFSNENKMYHDSWKCECHSNKGNIFQMRSKSHIFSLRMILPFPVHFKIFRVYGPGNSIMLPKVPLSFWCKFPISPDF